MTGPRAQDRCDIHVGASRVHGKGAFTSRRIAAGECFHTAPLFIFGCEDAPHVARTRAAHYVFYISDCPETPGLEVTGLALSAISFVNHARPANTTFVVDPAAGTVSFTAARVIDAGEEIFIDYGDFAERLGIA